MMVYLSGKPGKPIYERELSLRPMTCFWAYIIYKVKAFPMMRKTQWWTPLFANFIKIPKGIWLIYCNCILWLRTDYRILGLAQSIREVIGVSIMTKMWWKTSIDVTWFCDRSIIIRLKRLTGTMMVILKYDFTISIILRSNSSTPVVILLVPGLLGIITACTREIHQPADWDGIGVFCQAQLGGW